MQVYNYKYLKLMQVHRAFKKKYSCIHHSQILIFCLCFLFSSGTAHSQFVEAPWVALPDGFLSLSPSLLPPGVTTVLNLVFIISVHLFVL